MVIIIRSGPGFPLVSKQSHITGGESAATSSPSPAEKFPQREGAVVVFDASMAIQDPEVTGVGGSGILLLY